MSILINPWLQIPTPNIGLAISLVWTPGNLNRAESSRPTSFFSPLRSSVSLHCWAGPSSSAAVSHPFSSTAEKIVKGDKGLFVLVGPNMFEFSLFGEDGVKPLCARPTVWNLFVALGDLPQFFQVLVRWRQEDREYGGDTTAGRPTTILWGESAKAGW